MLKEIALISSEEVMGIPWWSRSWDSVFSPPSVQVQSLLGELKYCRLLSMAKKKRDYIISYIYSINLCIASPNISMVWVISLMSWHAHRKFHIYTFNTYQSFYCKLKNFKFWNSSIFREIFMCGCVDLCCAAQVLCYCTWALPTCGEWGLL